MIRRSMAIGPELGNRIQRIRVELPNTAPELITKLRKANVDIDGTITAGVFVYCGLKYFGNNDKVTISWTEPNNQGSAITSYTI